ncbi:MAG TPA: enoyl-CoA hydratase-related protein, partial [Cellvibrionaceae bacterium]
ADVRLVLITGSGDSFTAGNDLADFASGTVPLNDQHPAPQFMRALMAVPQPVVAAVNGPAIGIGTTLLLHCDLVYASDQALFQTPFVSLGVCPEFGASVLLPQRIGVALANEMLLTGRKLDALAALKAGLINGVYSMERFDDEMTDLIRSLLALPPGAMAASKALLHGFGKDSLHQVISEELAVFAQCLAGDECRGIFKALAAKRQKGG